MELIIDTFWPEAILKTRRRGRRLQVCEPCSQNLAFSERDDRADTPSNEESPGMSEKILHCHARS